MNIRRGRTRLVIAFPWLGFVIKLPIIHISLFYWNIKNILQGEWKTVMLLWRIRRTNRFSIKYQLVGGFVANRTEWTIWQKTHNQLLQPTWFSLLGVINIQKFGDPISDVRVEWLGMHLQKATNRRSHHFSRSHTFGSSANYTNVKGNLRLLDYGDVALLPVIVRYGGKIAELTVTQCSQPPMKS